MEQNKNHNLPPTTFCRTGCGFYGNESFEGLCSKCYKDQLKRKQSSSPVTGAGRMSPSALTAAAGELDVVQSVSSTLAKTSLGTTPDNSSSGSSVASTPTTTTPSVETATPTVQFPNPGSQNSDKNTEDEGATGGAENQDQTMVAGASTSDKKKRNRCHTCKKKVGLTGFECRCGGLYCSLHRYSDKHECSFDYKEMAQEQIRKNNPVIVGEKIQKI